MPEFNPESMIGVRFIHWSAQWIVKETVTDDKIYFRCDWVDGMDRNENDKKGVYFSLKDVLPNVILEPDNLGFLAGLEFERLTFGIWKIESVGTLNNGVYPYMIVSDRVGNKVIEQIGTDCLDAILYRIELFQDFDPVTTEDEDRITLEKISSINKQIAHTWYELATTGKSVLLIDKRDRSVHKMADRLVPMLSWVEKTTLVTISL